MTLVTRYGMSEKLGTVLYGSEHSSDEVFLGRDFSSGKNYSEKTAAEIDDEIRSIINSSYATCKKYLTEHIDKLHFVASFLLKNESMDEEQFKAAMETDNPTIEDIEKIAVEKKKKSEEENKTAHERNEKAEAEARAKAEAAAAESDRIAREAFGASKGFSSDDFFKNVWQTPDISEEDIKEETNNADAQENDAQNDESDNKDNSEE